MTDLGLCTLSRWNALCLSLGLSADGETYQELIHVHSEAHRAYHTLGHISACLNHLDDVISKVDNAQEIEMALWFHDAVYEPFSASNEEDSAEWAADWLQERGANKAVISRIADHILDTKSHDKPKTLDGQYMLDIDQKRKTILQNFLARDRIYATNYFYDKLENQARINLIRAISQL